MMMMMMITTIIIMMMIIMVEIMIMIMLTRDIMGRCIGRRGMVTRWLRQLLRRCSSETSLDVVILPTLVTSLT